MGIAVFPAPSAGGLSVQKTQTFTSSGTFTLPSGYGVSKPLIVTLEICGGGGGGGSGAVAAATRHGGGGGGSGVTTVFERIPLTANATITIGAGGTGGAAVSGGSFAGNDGTNGGDSHVNSLYYSPGGGYGTGGLNGTGSMRAGSVATQGYYIPGPYVGSTELGLGGSGGSGGAGAASIGSNPLSLVTYRGGIYGCVAGNFPSGNTSTAPTNNDVGGLGAGMVLFFTNVFSGTNAGSGFRFDPLQRGGGGGGGSATTTGTYGIGGLAGTANSGGLTGIRSQTTGQRNGETATVPGCGGGGGGGAFNTTSGSGGNGAAGYVTISWLE